MQQLVFVNKEYGTWVFLPLYSEKDWILDIHAKATGSKRKRREVEISLEKSSPLELEILSAEGSGFSVLDADSFRKGYVFNPFPSSDFYASIRFSLSGDYGPEDLGEDGHIGKSVRDKSTSLVDKDDSPYENARRIYDYVFGIPSTGEKLVGPAKPMTPAQVIKSNKARKCVCRAELFKDLCIASGISARELSGEVYGDNLILKYQNQKRRPTHGRGHAFATFYDNGWHLADPTLGGFGSSFRALNYYEKVVAAIGMESIDAAVRKD
ncbi:TPA: transglutaminase domain-containing protein [Candidatus Woesearchaeota archaeon]|nr:transglutaminase domain-containing protein [Candidatus Woesearchaeota archaeon]HIH40957.1 transglutaminase domain-containing protein [Candidatus Woesearchaeota archaeon]